MEQFKSCVHIAHAPIVTAHVPFRSGPQETGASYGASQEQPRVYSCRVPARTANNLGMHVSVSLPLAFALFIDQPALCLNSRKELSFNQFLAPQERLEGFFLGAVVVAVALLHLETCLGVQHPREGPDTQKAPVHGHQTVSVSTARKVSSQACICAHGPDRRHAASRERCSSFALV
jgi:hypothetical protein